MAYRSALLGDIADLTRAMTPFAGTRYQVQVFTESRIEHSLCREIGDSQWHMNAPLIAAGWTIDPTYPVRRSNLHAGVFVLTVRNDMNEQADQLPAGRALAEYLDTHNIATWAGLVRNDELWNPGIRLVIEIGPKPETMEQHRTLRKAYRERVGKV